MKMNQVLLTRIARILDENVFFASTPCVTMDSYMLAHDIENGADALSTMLNYLHEERHSADEPYD
jgi:hypothetical protein